LDIGVIEYIKSSYGRTSAQPKNDDLRMQYAFFRPYHEKIRPYKRNVLFFYLLSQNPGAPYLKVTGAAAP